MTEVERIRGDRLKLAVFISHPVQYFSPLFEEMAELIDVHVFYYSDHNARLRPGDPSGHVWVWDIPLLEGYQFTMLPSVGWLKTGYIGPWRLNRGLFRALRAEDWDAVLLFGYSSLNEWALRLLTRLLQIPILYLSDSELLRQRSWVRVAAKELVVRLFFRGISAFLAIGDNNRQYALRYGIEPERIYPAAYPIDVSRFQRTITSEDSDAKLSKIRQSWNIPDNALVVLFCAQLIERKRPLDLVQALERVRVKDRPVVAVFVGSGPLEDALRRTASNRVIVTGFVNQSEIPWYFCLSDILVLPSEYEPFGLVVTEAAALGVPAVVSDRVGCVGNHDVLRPNESGLVYPCGDIQGLADSIQALLEDEHMRARMGKRAMEFAKAQAPDVVARQIRDALVDIVPDLHVRDVAKQSS